MKRNNIYSGTAAALGLLILILDGKTALAGATQGVELCIRTVIPSLFPFFVLSGILTSAFLGIRLPPFLRIPGIPKGAESLAAVGLLGGYPVGAQNIASAYRSGVLSKGQAERMLAFCNNAGPAFLFGMIGPSFPDIRYAWLLWMVHIASALLTGCFLAGDKAENASVTAGHIPTLPETLQQSLRIMASVCGWIVLFRVLIAFLDRWILWLLPNHWKIILTGLLELANGCCAIPAIQNIELRFYICSGLLAFGGLCVTMQTVSVTSGLSLRYYFPGKLLQTALSILIAWMLFPSEPKIAVFSGAFLAISAVCLRKMQNNSSIPMSVGV